MCNVVRFRSCFLYSDDFKIFREIISSHGSYLLQFDINYICRWWNSEYLKLNINNTRVISFSRAANVFGACKNCVITRSKIGNCVLQNQTSFPASCWLHISHGQLDFGFNSVVNFYFFPLSREAFDAVTYKTEYIPVAWNALNSTAIRKLEHIQRKFLFLVRHHFFNRLKYNYADFDFYLKFRTLCVSRQHLDVLYS